MKKNNAKRKMFALISEVAVFLMLFALAGCDADSIGQSNGDITLDLSDTDVIAALFSASEGNDFWAEDSEEMKLLELDADEPSTVRCLPLDCDVDKDGFAWECERYHFDSTGAISEYGNVPNCKICAPICTNCFAREITCVDEDHCMCPAGTIQFTEPRRCDHSTYFWNGTNHDVPPAELDKLFHEWATPTSPLAPRYLRQIRPRQSESYYDGIDDDCDGYVDQTEYVYKEFGNEVGDNGFTIRAVINDYAIMQHANYIIAIVYELDNISRKDQTEIKRGLLPKEKVGFTWVYKYKKMFGFPYNSDHRVDLEIRDKLAFGDDNKVYAVGLAYFRLIPTPWGSWFPLQIGCIDSSGNPDYSFMFTGGSCSSKRNRITSDIYYGAVGVSVDLTALHPKLTKMRTAVTNRAIYEWNLSERGLVGGQDLDDLGYSPPPPMPLNPWQDIELPDGTYPAVVGGASPAKAPDGTRYSAGYGEDWCTEYSSSVFNWVSSQVPYEQYISDMMGWFDKYGILRRYNKARENIYNKRGEFYGSYLIMNPRMDASGQEGSHSGIFLGCDYELDNVWRVHGCSNRLISLDNQHKYNRMEIDVDGNVWYKFMGLGRFTDQNPDLLPY